MSHFIQRLLDRENRPVKRSSQWLRLQVEPLEDRLTPCMACPNLTLSHVIDVTSAPSALAPPDAGPQVAIFCDGSVRIASGGAEQAASFEIKDVASLSLSPGQGETSIKIHFDEPIPLTLAGASVSAEIKGDAVVSLKLGADGATAVASIKFTDVLSLNLDVAPAEADVTVEFNGTGGIAVFGDPTRFPADLPSVSFTEAASLTTSQDGVVSVGTGGGAGKVSFADTWDNVLTGPATDCHFARKAGLLISDTPVLINMEKWDITPAAPAVGTTSPSSLMLAGTESLTLNFLTANMEYKNQWQSVGDVTSLEWHDPIYMNFEGGSATATQEGHLQMTGECNEVKYTDDITLTPNDPNDLASSMQGIECLGGRHLTLTVDDTVDLMVAGLELTSQTHQTETGDEISIELNSLLATPEPGPGG
jgi:hypothetical protein